LPFLDKADWQSQAHKRGEKLEKKKAKKERKRRGRACGDLKQFNLARNQPSYLHKNTHWGGGRGAGGGEGVQRDGAGGGGVEEQPKRVLNKDRAWEGDK